MTLAIGASTPASSSLRATRSPSAPSAPSAPSPVSAIERAGETAAVTSIPESSARVGADGPSPKVSQRWGEHIPELSAMAGGMLGGLIGFGVIWFGQESIPILQGLARAGHEGFFLRSFKTLTTLAISGLAGHFGGEAGSWVGLKLGTLAANHRPGAHPDTAPSSAPATHASE